MESQRAWFAGRGWEVDVLDAGVPPRARDVRELFRAGRRIRAGAAGALLHCHGVRCAAAAFAAGLRPFVTLHGATRVRDEPAANHLFRLAGLRAVPLVARGAFTAAPEHARSGWRFVAHASPRLAALTRAPFPDGDAPVFAWIGRLAAPKRPLDFVRAARAIPGARVVVAGDGPLAAEVAAAGAEVLGWVDDPAPVIAASWAVALFSDSEAVPFALQEAMWCGRAVAASPLPGVRWLVGDDASEDLTPYASRRAAADAGEAAATRVRRVLRPGDPWPAILEAYGRSGR